MKLNISEAQKIVREASPEYLAQNPPVGTMAVLADMKRRLTPAEFRKPFVRRPDENDLKQECPMCDDDGECYICEDQAYVSCPYCGGDHLLPWNYNQVFIIVYRDFISVEALVEAAKNGDCSAVVTVDEPGFKAGDKIELTDAEKDLCLKEVGKLPPTTTEGD